METAPSFSASFTGAPVRVALIGFGNAGRSFHAPVISGVPGLVLHCVVSTRPDAVHAEWPGQHVVPTAADALADPLVELVVIASTNETHHPLARAALLAGKHVLIDKPCTVTLAETQDLLALAAVQQRVLTVYQSRRFDADFLTLAQVVADGELGRLVHFESHFDRYRPEVLDRWRDKDLPGSGLWLDLGSHLVDQCRQLFGMPDDLLLDLALQRDSAQVHDAFHAKLRYDRTRPGFRAVLHAGTVVPAATPRFALHGTLGSFIKWGVDSQEDALKAGQRPSLAALGNWGHDPQPGEITTVQNGKRVSRPAPVARGNYMALYAQLRDHVAALRTGTAGATRPTVLPQEVLQTMALLSLGEQSAREGRFVATTGFGAPAEDHQPGL